MPSSGTDHQPIGSGRRDQLLAAARAVLSEHGYERTTVSSIATRAQVAQGTFYLYFPSKEALPGALARQLSEAVGERIRSVTEEGPPLAEAVERLVPAVYAAAEEFSDVLLVANRGIELCESLEAFLELTAAWRGALEDFLHHYRESGEIDQALEPRTTAYVLRDLLDRAMKARVLFGHDEYAESTALLLRRALEC